MKIKLMMIMLISVFWISGSDNDCNSLGVIYPANGKPLIAVNKWKEVNYKIKDFIDSRFISVDKWPDGKNVYVVSQEWGNRAKVKKLFFNDGEGCYQNDPTWNKQKEMSANELSKLSLVDCSYLICIPEKLDSDFLRSCAQLINLACNNRIPTAIHYSLYCISANDLPEILRALVNKKCYAIINDGKIEKIIGGIPIIDKKQKKEKVKKTENLVVPGNNGSSKIYEASSVWAMFVFPMIILACGIPLALGLIAILIQKIERICL